MTALDTLHAFQWLTLRAGGPSADLKILAGTESGMEGLDLPEFRTALTVRHADGQHGGAQHADVASPACRVYCTDTATLMVLRAAMKPRPDPSDEQPWTFRGFGFPEDTTWRMWVRPTICDYRATLLGTAGSVWMVDLEWMATDPTVYSDELHEFDSTDLEIGAFSTWSPTIVNAGSAPTLNGRALRVEITAATNCVGPMVRIPTRNQIVTWPGLQLAAGQTFRWETDRTSWVGGQRVDGRRTPFTVPPVLLPGDNPMEVGVASGTCHVKIQYRDTH